MILLTVSSFLTQLLCPLYHVFSRLPISFSLEICALRLWMHAYTERRGFISREVSSSREVEESMPVNSEGQSPSLSHLGQRLLKHLALLYSSFNPQLQHTKRNQAWPFARPSTDIQCKACHPIAPERVPHGWRRPAGIASAAFQCIGMTLCLHHAWKCYSRLQVCQPAAVNMSGVSVATRTFATSHPEQCVLR